MNYYTIMYYIKEYIYIYNIGVKYELKYCMNLILNILSIG